MRSLNEHVSVILPLIAFLISFEFFQISQKLTLNYSNSINSNYSIIIISDSTIDESVVKNSIDNLKSLSIINPDSITDRLQGEISDTNLALLKISIPKFYRITLKRLPSIDEIKTIKKRLLTIKHINRVETFKKNHDNIYNLLNFFGYVTQIFFSLIITLSLLLIIKQSTLWQHKHSQRVMVLSYFGAPSWMRNGILIKNAFIDSIISSILTIGLVYLILNSSQVIALIDNLDLSHDIINYKSDFLLFLLLCFIINFITLSLAVFRIRN